MWYNFQQIFKVLNNPVIYIKLTGKSKEVVVRMKKVYKGMCMLDVENGRVVEDAVIVVEDGIFAAAGGADTKIPEDAEVNDLNGKTVLPGLVDAHIHALLDASANPTSSALEDSQSLLTLKGAEHLKKILAAGIVAVRDLGGIDFLDLGLRDAVNSGLILGPRMQVAGKVVTMTGGHGHDMGREADGPAECRKAAREQLKMGADLIKVMATGGVMTEGVEPGSPQLTEEELRAAIEEAHKAGRKTATHAQGTEGIKNALRAGIDSIEHGFFLDDEAVELMIENDVYMVATLAAPYWIVENGVEAGIPEYAVEKAERTMEAHKKSFQKAYHAGVKIAMGTDAGTPFNLHGKNSYELKMMVDAGVPPMEAVRVSTMGGAELMGIDDRIGSITVGKDADMLICSGRPDENIEDIFELDAVYLKGKKVMTDCGLS